MSQRVLTSEERKFVRTEGFHPNLTRYSKFIVNNDAADVTPQTLGLPLKDDGAGNYEICFAGDEASATAFGMEFQKFCILANDRSQRKVLAIEHGPIVVSIEGLPINDPNDAPYDQAALRAALEALPASKLRIMDNTDNLQAQVP